MEIFKFTLCIFNYLKSYVMLWAYSQLNIFLSPCSSLSIGCMQNDKAKMADRSYSNTQTNVILY